MLTLLNGRYATEYETKNRAKISLKCQNSKIIGTKKTILEIKILSFYFCIFEAKKRDLNF
jgi:hypothetical protein